MENVPEELYFLPIVGIIRRRAHENETVIGLVLRNSGIDNSHYWYGSGLHTPTGGFVRIGLFYTLGPRMEAIGKFGRVYMFAYLDFYFISPAQLRLRRENSSLTLS
jgi:hypothetical protein